MITPPSDEMVNGLTEDETATTASCAGLVSGSPMSEALKVEAWSYSRAFDGQPQVTRSLPWAKTNSSPNTVEPLTSHSAATARIAELEAEVLEQARLNGMGTEREAALLARVAELERQVEAMRAKYCEAVYKYESAVNKYIAENSRANAAEAQVAQLRAEMAAGRDGK